MIDFFEVAEVFRFDEPRGRSAKHAFRLKGGGGKGGSHGQRSSNRQYNSLMRQLQPFKDQLGVTNAALTGTADQFAQFAAGQDPQIEAQRAQQIGGLNDEFARRGVFGGAALGEVGKVNQRLDLEAIANRDSQLQTAADLRQAAQQNLLAAPTLAAMARGATNQGRSSSKK